MAGLGKRGISFFFPQADYRKVYTALIREIGIRIIHVLVIIAHDPMYGKFRVDFKLRRVGQPTQAAPVAGGARPPDDPPSPAAKRQATDQRKSQLSATAETAELPIGSEKPLAVWN